MDAQQRISDLIGFCRGLPHVEEDIKWDCNRVFMIGGKMFCVFAVDQSVAVKASFKVDDHRFLEFTDRPQFIPAPYLARARWVGLVDLDGLAQAELTDLIRHSYRHYFGKLTKKRQRELGGE